MDDRLIGILAEMPRMRTAPGRCVRLRGRIDCRACVEACRLEIPFSSRDGILDADGTDGCSACGACAAACPTGAIEVPETTLSSWLRLIDEVVDRSPGEASCFSCSAAGDGDVACLRAWDAALLLRAFARGASDIMLRTADCTRCDRSGPRDDVQDLVRRTDAFARESGIGSVRLERITAVPPVERTGVAVDRREFFTSLRDGGRSLLGALMDELLPPPSSAAGGEIAAGEAAPRRTIAMDALGALISRYGRITSAVAGGAPGALSLRLPVVAGGSGCDLCGDCATFCPTGALRSAGTEGRWSLALSPARCVGCGLCERLCVRSAMMLEERQPGEIAVAGSSVLADGRLATCGTCGATFAQEAAEGSDGAPLCRACRGREDRFSGCY